MPQRCQPTELSCNLHIYTLCGIKKSFKGETYHQEKHLRTSFFSWNPSWYLPSRIVKCTVAEWEKCLKGMMSYSKNCFGFWQQYNISKHLWVRCWKDCHHLQGMKRHPQNSPSIDEKGLHLIWTITKKNPNLNHKFQHLSQINIQQYSKVIILLLCEKYLGSITHSSRELIS